MAFLGTEKLKQLIKSQAVIGPNPDYSRIVCGAYELSLGEEVFITDSREKKKEFLKKPKEQITINPGQFALLLTSEVITIPKDKIAFISIKAKIKLKGLVNVSGFHVDPGFSGKLLFSVYNAGSGPISLQKEDRCFLIWFSDLQLTEGEQTSYAIGDHDHKNQDTIPLGYIDHLISGELASPSVLSKRIEEIRSDIETRVGLIEKEQTAKDYLVKTAVGLGIIIIIKFILDWLSYDNGFQKGLELKERELKTDSIINLNLIEIKNSQLSIDSLHKLRLIEQRKLDSINVLKSKQNLGGGKNGNK